MAICSWFSNLLTSLPTSSLGTGHHLVESGRLTRGHFIEIQRFLFCFLQEHYQDCSKFPQACEKCGKENIPRDMVNHFSVIIKFKPIAYRCVWGRGMNKLNTMGAFPIWLLVSTARTFSPKLVVECRRLSRFPPKWREFAQAYYLVLVVVLFLQS